MSSQVSLSLNVIVMDDRGLSIEVPSDVPISRILPRILEHVGNHQSLDQENYTFFIARPISNLPSEGEKTLSELNVRSGDALYIVHLNVTSSKIQFLFPNGTTPVFEVTRSPTVIGRDKDDPGLAAFPLDIDLAPFLRPEQQKLISRRQARFTLDEDGRWTIQLHERANAPMFLDNQQITSTKPVRVKDESLITIGAEGKHNIHFNLRLAGQ